MLEVELDIFSGMPNPRWVLSPQEERELTERVEADTSQLSEVTSPDEVLGLGYRGFIVRSVKSEHGAWDTWQAMSSARIGAEFRVGVRTAAREVDSVAHWLLAAPATRMGIADELLSVAAGGPSILPAEREELYPPSPDSFDESPDVERGVTWHRPCPSTLYAANADIFNSPGTVEKNNCYCFASNHVANIRHALPGRRGGKPAASPTVDNIRGGLYADGWADNCQTNTLVIAAHVWPGWDYHFYRLVSPDPNWLWYHKTGGTPAVYLDGAGYPIRRQVTGGGSVIWRHPQNCVKTPPDPIVPVYTEFVGWFYQRNATALVA
ncbi:hypothetical protein [Streptomyces agglomeratus]|uniref:hypothetical protein n=1 Tax=Streptomyces agglomeratus TaxID=285458 RepID=UPI0009A082F5|nr:hypothetical protein [Streptomyces agglomeratus]